MGPSSRSAPTVRVSHSRTSMERSGFTTQPRALRSSLSPVSHAPSSMAVSPDGAKLATASSCGGFRIWALDIGDLLEIAHREVPNVLTDEDCRQYLHVNRCPQA